MPTSKVLMPYNTESYDENGTHSLIWRARRCIEGFDRACHILPIVDRHGHSESPVHADLYRDAQEWEDELREQRQQLLTHHQEATDAIERSQQAQYDDEHDEDPRCAGFVEQHERDRARHQRGRAEIEEVITAVNAALERGAATIAARRAG